MSSNQKTLSESYDSWVNSNLEMHLVQLSYLHIKNPKAYKWLAYGLLNNNLKSDSYINVVE